MRARSSSASPSASTVCCTSTGYVRIDWRLREDGEPYFLEANPNPEIARSEEFASSAEASGLAYEPMIQRILGLGLSR